MTNKEVKIRVPPDKAIEKLEHLLNIEIRTLEGILNRATEIKRELLTRVHQEMRQNISAMYDQKLSEYVYHKHIHAIIEYISLIEYAKQLRDDNVMYAFETQWGDLRITYKPYLLQKEEER